MIRSLILLLLIAIGAEAAWLEDLRWFKHDSFTRVVFDLSEPTEYRISRQLERGYVDVLFQGEIRRRMPESIVIQTGGVIRAEELRKTSTSLTYRIHAEGMEDVRTMTLDEQPYKIVIDFYSDAPAKPIRKPEARVEQAQTPVEKPATKVQKPARAQTAASPPVTEVDRYQGLDLNSKRRVYIAELLMQLSDTLSAAGQLAELPTTMDDKPVVAMLKALAYLNQGDDYRAARLLGALRGVAGWEESLAMLESRLREPGADGSLPGGEISEQDLTAFIDLMRRGRVLSSEDLYRTPEAKASGSFGLVPGMIIGFVLGMLILGLREWQTRQARLKERYRKILEEEPGTVRKTPVADSLKDDYAEVSRRVREELESQLEKAGKDADPDQERTIPAETRDDDSLEARVYRLADESNSIVQIAEQLNLGVDEVRLILELRENAGQLSNG
jgi:hypothetical protein